MPRLIRRMIPQSWQRAISEALPDNFHGRMLTREWFGGTDWSSTTVFPIPSYFLGFLRVNLRGRDPHGVVEPGADYEKLLERVEEDLSRLIDPQSGQPAVRYIARTVDLYQTDPHESLPDIFFDWAPTPYPKRRIEHPHAVLEQKDMFFNRDTRHNLKGFLQLPARALPAGEELPTYLYSMSLRRVCICWGSRSQSRCMVSSPQKCSPKSQ